jgi:hypothetical protein
MQTELITPGFSINGCCINTIIFDESHYATLWATARINNTLQRVNLVLSFNKLNDMLRFSGSKGEQLLLAMVDAMMDSTEPPYKIDIESVLGAPFVCSTVKFTIINKVTAMDSNIDATYLIDEVWPITIIEQAKNLAQLKKDFKHIQIINESVLNFSLSQLKQMYAQYLGLLELDINEDAARNRAGLANDKLFEMAKLCK